jgi:hypothetical protein
MVAARKPFSPEIIIYFATGREITLKTKSYFGLRSRSYFEYKGGHYQWDGATVLKTAQDGTLVAKFDRSSASLTQDGRLEIYTPGKDMIDIIIATLMMEIWIKHTEE